MRYEVLKKYEPQPGRANVGIPNGTPLEVRIFPENTDVRSLFVAMVQSAYEMDGTPGLGGLAALHEPNFITAEEAKRWIRYDSERSLIERILRRPDTRVPKGISADHIKGRAVKLMVAQSTKVPGTYEMATHVFAREVGSIDRLFELAREKLD